MSGRNSSLTDSKPGSNVEKQAVKEPEIIRPSPNKLLYISAAAVVLVVFIVTVGQSLFGLSDVVYKQETLTVLYAVLSLAAALLTFGVIGDSGALINFTQTKGTTIRISGSAAGFVVFYYLLSSGLNPYTHLDVFLYKNGEALMMPSDGDFEVTIASRISQVEETESGQAAFSVPRTESTVRIFVNSISGQLWEKHEISPSECVDENGLILLSCSSVDVHLKKSSACLSDFRISSYEAKAIDTTLAIVVDSLKENLQNLSIDLPVNVEFTNSLLEKGLHQSKFRLERKNKSARGVCEHLAAIENGYNWTQEKRVIKSYLSCNKMLFALADENITEGYNQCL